jgi:hypothetical protein
MTSPHESADPVSGGSTMTSPHESADPVQPAAELLPEVYAELRRLAAALTTQLRPGQTLQPTALIHEAYLRLVRNWDPGWDGRRHFFGAPGSQQRRQRRPRQLRRDSSGQRQLGPDGPPMGRAHGRADLHLPRTRRQGGKSLFQPRRQPPLPSPSVTVTNSVSRESRACLF